MRSRTLAAVLAASAALTWAPAAHAAETPVVSTADVLPHLQEFQRIADRNGGNRAHGTRGYQESLDYVKERLDAAGFRTSVEEFEHDGAKGYNLIADWPGGDENQVVLLGAHLDSVPAGPGISDNATGSAAILATALAVSEAHLAPAKHLRFAWWGAEEPGLIGSAKYVAARTPEELAKIAVYLNFDMTGSKGDRQWLVIHAGAPATDVFERHFADRGIPTFDIGVGGSDHESFDAAGVPVSGFTNGIGACIHDACDTIDNVDPEAEVISTNAIIQAVWSVAGA
ncbi:M28 family peptidase [Saccharopolyspora shandongensis]|uniref:Aminopeptidase S n=1 Tax=Saccharopolyspora shandongensis TaxID=418495 RepID=A0A1H2ZRB3_9PSEU|nr:M28 family peptidase [Saccharopolyspora shandongensis]SDX19875.1 aminopeptidase S [Saccharopolyspora shandongensis]